MILDEFCGRIPAVPEDQPDQNPTEIDYKAIIGTLMKKLHHFSTTCQSEDLRRFRLANVQLTKQKNGDWFVTVYE